MGPVGGHLIVKFGAKHVIPQFGGDTVTGFIVLIMVSQMVLLHLFEVEFKYFGVVQIIVCAIISNVSEYRSPHDGICCRGGE